MNNLAENRLTECFEVIKSFLYFVVNYVQIEDKQTSQAIPFDLWPAQKAILPKFLTALRLIILKARQLGLTWLTAAYCLWLAITRPLQLIVVISAKEDWAKEFLDRIIFILNRLPDWLYPPIKRQTTEVIEFDHRDEDGNSVLSIIKSLPTTEEGAQGKTPTLLVIDESALNRYFKQIFASSKPGLDAAQGRMIIISNAIKTAPGWPFTREIYQGSMRGENDFERIFMPWWDCPQRPKDFIARQLREGMSEEDIEQHYPASEDQAISALLGSYFGKSLSRHTKTMKGATGVLAKDKQEELIFTPHAKGHLEVWRYPYHLTEDWDGESWWTKRYCLGADVSEGLGQSYSVAYVYDRLLDELVARWRSNRVDAYRFADAIHLLSCWYRNALDWTREEGVTHEKALACVERTGAGQTTVKQLEDLKANQYVRVIPATLGAPLSKELGWSENNQSKHDLCEDLRQGLKIMKGALYDAVLVDECSTWIQHEGTTKLGPEEGKFGDCVIAAGCAIQASLFMEGSPKRLSRPLTGWRQQLTREGEGVSPWAM